jgi:hypothetical protein
MRAMKIAFVILVASIALLSFCHRPPKIADRFPMDTGGPARTRNFCAGYYAWRETQAAGGVTAVDRLCFDAQEMRP